MVSKLEMAAIYLWSEASPASTRLLPLVQQIPGVQTLQIDHPSIRKKILNSSRVRVETVPCILEAGPGKLLQYEGAQAFQWVQYKRGPPPELPQMGQPMMGQPMMGPPPGMGQPMMGQPMMGPPPGMGQPMMGQPMMGQPMMGQPMMGQPMMGQPMMGPPPGMPEESGPPEPPLVFHIPNGPYKNDPQQPQQPQPGFPQQPQPGFPQQPQPGFPQQPQPGFPQQPQQIPQQVTPISQVLSEPPTTPQPVYQQNLPQMTASAAQHYAAAAAQQNMSPKEKAFQQMMAQAAAENAAREAELRPSQPPVVQ